MGILVFLASCGGGSGDDAERSGESDSAAESAASATRQTDDGDNIEAGDGSDSDDDDASSSTSSSRAGAATSDTTTPADATSSTTSSSSRPDPETDDDSAGGDSSGDSGSDPNESDDDLTPITSPETGSIEITELSVTPELYEAASGRSQLRFSLVADRCVFIRITGATTLYNPDWGTEECGREHLSVLKDQLGPGDYSITVEIWDEQGTTTSRTTSFTVPPASPDPCRWADSMPESWTVKAGSTAQLELAVAGDCGPVTWTSDTHGAPEGFRLVDNVIHASPTGPARAEVFQVTATPTRGVFLWTRIDLLIVTDDTPELEPCKPSTDQSLVENGVLQLRVRIGETVSTRFEAVGDCGAYRWDHEPLPAGVSFNDGLLTVTGQTLGSSGLLFISLHPEQGTSWASAFQVTGIE